MSVNVDPDSDIPLKEKLNMFLLIKSHNMAGNKYLDNLTQEQIDYNVYHWGNMMAIQQSGGNMYDYIESMGGDDFWQIISKHASWASTHMDIKSGRDKDQLGLRITCPKRCLSCLVERQGKWTKRAI